MTEVEGKGRRDHESLAHGAVHEQVRILAVPNVPSTWREFASVTDGVDYANEPRRKTGVVTGTVTSTVGLKLHREA